MIRTHESFLQNHLNLTRPRVHKLAAAGHLWKPWQLAGTELAKIMRRAGAGRGQIDKMGRDRESRRWMLKRRSPTKQLRSSPAKHGGHHGGGDGDDAAGGSGGADLTASLYKFSHAQRVRLRHWFVKHVKKNRKIRSEMYIDTPTIRPKAATAEPDDDNPWTRDWRTIALEDLRDLLISSGVCRTTKEANTALQRVRRECADARRRERVVRKVRREQRAQRRAIAREGGDPSSVPSPTHIEIGASYGEGEDGGAPAEVRLTWDMFLQMMKPRGDKDARHLAAQQAQVEASRVAREERANRAAQARRGVLQSAGEPTRAELGQRHTDRQRWRARQRRKELQRRLHIDSLQATSRAQLLSRGRHRALFERAGLSQARRLGEELQQLESVKIENKIADDEDEDDDEEDGDDAVGGGAVSAGAGASNLRDRGLSTGTEDAEETADGAWSGSGEEGALDQAQAIVRLERRAARRQAALVKRVTKRVQAHAHRRHLTLSSLFNNFDAEADGVLTVEELRDGLNRSIGVVLSDAEARAIFAYCDADQSGGIDVVELRNAFRKHHRDRCHRRVRRRRKRRHRMRRMGGGVVEQTSPGGTTTRVPTESVATDELGDPNVLSLDTVATMMRRRHIIDALASVVETNDETSKKHLQERLHALEVALEDTTGLTERKKWEARRTFTFEELDFDDADIDVGLVAGWGGKDLDLEAHDSASDYSSEEDKEEDEEDGDGETKDRGSDKEDELQSEAAGAGSPSSSGSPGRPPIDPVMGAVLVVADEAAERLRDQVSAAPRVTQESAAAQAAALAIAAARRAAKEEKGASMEALGIEFTSAIDATPTKEVQIFPKQTHSPTSGKIFVETTRQQYHIKRAKAAGPAGAGGAVVHELAPKSSLMTSPKRRRDRVDNSNPALPARRSINDEYHNWAQAGMQGITKTKIDRMRAAALNAADAARLRAERAAARARAREEEEEQERQDAAEGVLREKRKRFRLKLEDQKRAHVSFLREQNKERHARKRKELTERLMKQREVEWARQEEKDKRLLKAAEEKAQIMINLRERVRRRQAEQQKQAIDNADMRSMRTGSASSALQKARTLVSFFS